MKNDRVTELKHNQTKFTANEFTKNQIPSEFQSESERRKSSTIKALWVHPFLVENLTASNQNQETSH